MEISTRIILNAQKQLPFTSKSVKLIVNGRSVKYLTEYNLYR